VLANSKRIMAGMEKQSQSGGGGQGEWLLQFNLAAGNQALDSHSLTPPPQREGEEKQAEGGTRGLR